MENEYSSYIKEDPNLYDAVRECLPALKEMSPVQIEKLIFFLKSLHTYYPKSENHVAFLSEFSDKLDRIKNSQEQLSLQRKASIAALKAIFMCVAAGMLLAVGIASLLGGQQGLGIVLVVIAGACIFLADAKFWKQSTLISKEQDRKYFLASIREASACNELDWAGLFSYHKASKMGPQTDADIERSSVEVGEISSKLRAALYNDEYFQYSPASLRSVQYGAPNQE